MKTCPVCYAKAFDDAEVCFGCLHRFEEGDAEVALPVETSHEAPPEFRIRFIPVREHSGDFVWRCAVEA